MIHFLKGLDQPFGSPALSDDPQGGEGGEGGFHKKAERLRERQEELVGSPTSDFALVIYDGRETHPKFPIKTAEDIQLSKEALESASPELPDEVVKTARSQIDMAAREKLAESLYPDAETSYTNVVFTGDLDKRAFREKLAESRPSPSPDEGIVAGRFQVLAPQDVKLAERHIEMGLGVSEEEEAKASMQLIKRASEIGAEVSSAKVARFARTSVPASFEGHVDYRKRLAPDVLSEYYEDLKKEAASADSVQDVFRVAQTTELLDEFARFKPLEGEKRARSRLGKDAPTAWEAVFPEQSGEARGAAEKTASEDTIAKVASVFGEEFADLYREDEDAALSSLSPSERRAFQGVASS